MSARSTAGGRARGLLTGAALAVAALLAASSSTAQTPAPGSAGVAAAAAEPVGSSADIEQLRARAAAYWAARVAGDANKQWELLEPRGRGRTTPGEYAMERGAMKYLGYQVEDATVEGYFGTVKVRLLVQPLLVAHGKGPTPPAAFLLPDKWVRVQGVWYHVLEDESTGKAGPGGASR